MEYKLEITMTAEGSVRVNGPLENKLLCYALLGQATELVQKFDPKANGTAQPHILLPHPRLNLTPKAN